MEVFTAPILMVHIFLMLETSSHRPVIVKRAVIGSKGGWKLSTIFISCKVVHDWSIKTTEIDCIY